MFAVLFLDFLERQQSRSTQGPTAAGRTVIQQDQFVFSHGKFQALKPKKQAPEDACPYFTTSGPPQEILRDLAEPHSWDDYSSAVTSSTASSPSQSLSSSREKSEFMRILFLHERFTVSGLPHILKSRLPAFSGRRANKPLCPGCCFWPGVDDRESSTTFPDTVRGVESFEALTRSDKGPAVLSRYTPPQFYRASHVNVSRFHCSDFLLRG